MLSLVPSTGLHDNGMSHLIRNAKGPVARRKRVTTRSSKSFGLHVYQELQFSLPTSKDFSSNSKAEKSAGHFCVARFAFHGTAMLSKFKSICSRKDCSLKEHGCTSSSMAFQGQVLHLSEARENYQVLEKKSESEPSLLIRYQGTTAHCGQPAHWPKFLLQQGQEISLSGQSPGAFQNASMH